MSAKSLGINPSIWLLMRLNFIGFLRKVRKSIFTFGGGLSIIMVAIFLWALKSDTAHAKQVLLPVLIRQHYAALSIGGAIMLAFMIYSAVAAGFLPRGSKFSNAESQFLLSGPFKSKDIVTYKILHHTACLVLVVAIITECLPLETNSRIHFFIRSFTFSIMLSLFSFSCFTIRQRLAPAIAKTVETVLKRLGDVFGIGILLAGAAFLLSVLPLPLLQAWVQSSVFHALISPLLFFTKIFINPEEIGTLISATVCLSIAGALFYFSCLYFISTDELGLSPRAENSILAAQQATTQLEALRRKSQTHHSIPSFPNWGGLGPLLWTSAQDLLTRRSTILTTFFFWLGLDAVAFVLFKEIGFLGIRQNVGYNYFVFGLFFSPAITFQMLTISNAGTFPINSGRREFLRSLPFKPFHVILSEIAKPFFCSTILLSLLVFENYILCERFLPGRLPALSCFTFLVLGTLLNGFSSTFVTFVSYRILSKNPSRFRRWVIRPLKFAFYSLLLLMPYIYPTFEGTLTFMPGSIPVLYWISYVAMDIGLIYFIYRKTVRAYDGWEHSAHTLKLV